MLGLPPAARVVGWAGSLPFWRLVGGSSRLPGTWRVVLNGQQSDSLAKGYHARQVEACLLRYDIGALQGQPGGDMTVPGVQGDQPSSSDACQQGAHVKDNRQVEVEGSHPVTVNKDADGYCASVTRCVASCISSVLSGVAKVRRAAEIRS